MGTPHDSAFYGTATVGAKGQIVIPAKAREEMGINPGDMLVIFGHKDRKMIGICPAENVEAMLAEMTKKLNTIRTVIKETKEQDKKGN